MSRAGLRNLAIVLLLLACGVGFYLTRDTNGGRPAAKPAGGQSSLIDQGLVQKAQQMATLADVPQEQTLAREALRLTDHELDQAFATALREATAPSAPPAGPLRDLAARVAQLKTRLATSRRNIDQLTKKAEADDSYAGALELAKAQLSLDEDELEDAQQDLARAGGDEHAKLERTLEEHKAAEQQLAQPLKPATAPGTATMADQIRAWFVFRDKRQQLLAAAQQASNKASALERTHNSLENLLNHKADPNAPSPGEDEDAEEIAANVARLQKLSDQRKTLTELDRRIQDCRQLADVYRRWDLEVEGRQRGAAHLFFRSLALAFGVILAVFLADGAVRRVFLRHKADRRRLHQLRVAASIALRAVGALVLLWIVFGPPTQMTTILGLTTAGLTVVLKDFIVSFFGWFLLLGKNGIHIGDWVEIEGVGGEVIEIGPLKTVLLEMGKWTDTGHPTGRHVAFANSFAIEGHYFNFSTAGQWLWDELQVMLPSSGDPYQMAQGIRAVVERETEADALQAEQDWERVTHQYGTRNFSAKPTVDLRPSVNRLDVNVRYITRAPQRYEVKSRLFQRIVELLHQSSPRV